MNSLEANAIPKKQKATKIKTLIILNYLLQVMFLLNVF